METVHGGDLDAAVRRYGLRREDIRDFSGNINPLGMPEKAKRALIENVDKISTYPDKDYLSLRSAISAYTGADVRNITVGNGGTELISLFIRVAGVKNALIVAPVYSEYEREIRLNGGKCSYYALDEHNSFNADVSELCEKITDDIDMLAVCNPNNPTGTAITKADMEAVICRCADKSVKVLIDETYCEFADESVYSSIPLAEKFDNVIVIRGVSKFFASPGLRLGYAVCAETTIAAMSDIRDPWTVNILAAIAAEQFFADTEYIKKSKFFFEGERTRLGAELSKIRAIRAYETKTNFQLFKLLTDKVTSADIFERLIQQGMMVRDAKSFKFLDETFIRFCFLSKEDNDVLIREFKKILM